MRFRSTAYVGLIVFIIWTVAIALPFKPFSYLPPILVGGGPGTWFLLSYILYLLVSVAGSGVLSFFAYTIEVQEKRVFDLRTMALGFVLLNLGVVVSCLLLALAGGISGYGLTNGTATETSVRNLLSSFVYPIATSVVVSAAGAILLVVAMARAKVRAS
jgi:hypothetical protein